MGGLGSKRGFEFAAGCDVEDRVARGGLGVGVVPDAISSPDDGLSANAVRLGLSFDLVAKELRDGAEVEVDEHDRDQDLAGRESSNASTSGGGDDLFPVVLEAAVQRFDRLPSVIVELVPLLGLERERLFHPDACHDRTPPQSHQRDLPLRSQLLSVAVTPPARRLHDLA